MLRAEEDRAVIERANATMAGSPHAPVDTLVTAASELVALDLRLEAERAAPDRRSGPPVAIAVLDRAGFRFAARGVCAAPATSGQGKARR